jgi:hypothetical protein
MRYLVSNIYITMLRFRIIEKFLSVKNTADLNFYCLLAIIARFVFCLTFAAIPPETDRCIYRSHLRDDLTQKKKVHTSGC